jgi:hypothetical protein
MDVRLQQASSSIEDTLSIDNRVDSFDDVVKRLSNTNNGDIYIDTKSVNNGQTDNKERSTNNIDNRVDSFDDVVKRLSGIQQPSNFQISTGVIDALKNVIGPFMQEFSITKERLNSILDRTQSTLEDAINRA